MTNGKYGTWLDKHEGKTNSILFLFVVKLTKKGITKENMTVKGTSTNRFQLEHEEQLTKR